MTTSDARRRGTRVRWRHRAALAASGGALPALLSLAGCGQTLRALPPPAELESEAIEATQDYVIEATDVLQINVWKSPELSLEEVVVRPDGKISFPLLDDVHAAGLTPDQLKGILTERLSEYVTAPTVTVVVRQINSKMIYVIGEVNRVGPVPLRAHMRVIDALAIAGGFRPFAHTDRVKVIRQLDGKGPIEFQFDYGEFVEGTNLEQNILLLPGDRVVVP
jgi:polysaccharide export outer membrane protein